MENDSLKKINDDLKKIEERIVKSSVLIRNSYCNLKELDRNFIEQQKGINRFDRNLLAFFNILFYGGLIILILLIYIIYKLHKINII